MVAAINETKGGIFARLVLNKYRRNDKVRITPGLDADTSTIPYWNVVGNFDLPDSVCELFIHIFAALKAITSIPGPKTGQNFAMRYTIKEKDER